MAGKKITTRETKEKLQSFRMTPSQYRLLLELAQKAGCPGRIGAGFDRALVIAQRCEATNASK